MRNFILLLRTIWVLAKYRLLSHSGSLKLPWWLKLYGIKLDLLILRFPFIKPSQSFGSRLHKAFVELGPIYIKFGQTLSTRVDLVGVDIAGHLSKLQDKLPPFSYQIVAKELNHHFKVQEVFESIDETPVAAASISQVHKAKLKNGQPVAIKILRPDIEKQYRRDLNLLYKLGAWLEYWVPRSRRLKVASVVQVFEETMKQELDLRMEAAAASEMQEDFNHSKDVYIPKIYWEYVTHNIMVMEWVEGTSIYNQKQLLKDGHMPLDIATKLSVMFFQQAYQNGFFHADLHPGNILVSKSGQIILLDFGIMGRLDRANRLAVSEILEAFLRRDYMRVAEIHHEIGYIPEDTNLYLFAQTFRAIAEPILGKAAKDISIGKLLSHLFKVTEEYGMETQPQLLLLQKTTVVVEGIGKMLDPHINLWQLAEPWIKEWAQDNISVEAKLADLVSEIFKKIFKNNISSVRNGK